MGGYLTAELGTLMVADINMSQGGHKGNQRFTSSFLQQEWMLSFLGGALLTNCYHLLEPDLGLDPSQHATQRSLLAWVGHFLRSFAAAAGDLLMQRTRLGAEPIEIDQGRAWEQQRHTRRNHIKLLNRKPLVASGTLANDCANLGPAKLCRKHLESGTH